MNINKKDAIFIAGHTGLVGSSIVRKLKEYGYNNLIFINRKKIDLTNQKKNFKIYKKK